MQRRDPFLYFFIKQQRSGAAVVAAVNMERGEGLNKIVKHGWHQMFKFAFFRNAIFKGKYNFRMLYCFTNNLK